MVKIRNVISLFIILISLVVPCYAQDVIVNGRNTSLYFDGQSIPWSSLSNRNYILSPISPDSGFCVSIVNNNPTNSHSFTVTSFQTGDFNAVDYSHNTGRYASLSIVGTPSPIAASATGTFFVKSNGASKIVFSFSGGATQAGNPDTVDIYGVQTTANGCGTVNPNTGQSYTLSTPNTGTSATPPIQAISDGLSQAFSAIGVVTNPANAAILANINSNNGTRTVYMRYMTVSSNAAANVTFNFTTTTGSSCTAVPVANLKNGNSTVPTSLSNNLCGTIPTAVVAGSFSANVAANTTTTFDLQGYILPAGTTFGFDAVANGAVTGLVTINFTWYEK